jgi:hypothetical protein
MPSRLTEIGAHERPDHFHLPDDAMCYFWGEYTPWEYTSGKRWNFSATNKLVNNFKKKLDRKAYSDWQYKIQATKQISLAFSQFWKWRSLHENHHVALIPVPPSKTRSDPLYDGRMVDVLNGIECCVKLGLDIRDCLAFTGRYAASHMSSARPSPDELFSELSFDAAAGRPAQPPGVIFLFDDMLTTGAHHVAVTRLLANKFPDVPVIGNYVSRRVLPTPFADLDDFGAT